MQIPFTEMNRYRGKNELETRGNIIFFSLCMIFVYDVHVYVHAQSLLSCPTLCDPVDGSLPGSFVH